MPRVVSFIVLLAIIMLIGSMFFQVMVQFIVPLFLAAVLVVIFKPLHAWFLKQCGDRRKIAAALTTLAIVLIVLFPITGMLIKAVAEGAEMFGPEDTAAPQIILSQEEDDETDAKSEHSIYVVVDRITTHINSALEKFNLPQISNDQVHQYVDENLQKVAAPLALGGVRILASILIGLAIMVLTMYYFFADGPGMVSALMRLSPLEDTYELELLDKFGDISRAVVVAVLLSAIVQGVLAGFGYYLAGVERVFFLTSATAFLAMVPFVGAAAIWVPVCLYLYFYLDHTTAAIVLTVYCATVVSMIDNLIKPMVLHGQSNLHPLLALLSVIGGIQALGPIGILVGPMLVAFLQALLNMLNKELQLLGKEADKTGKPVVFATELPQVTATSLPMPLPINKTAERKGRKGKKK